MNPRPVQLNLTRDVVRELHRLLPGLPMLRAALLVWSEWHAQKHRGGSLATVTRHNRAGHLPGATVVPPFLTYRPDREGD